MTSPLGALYRLFLRHQLSRGRLVLAVMMTAAVIGISIVIQWTVPFESRQEAEVRFLSLFALGLLTPILSLVISSSTLGQLVDDETLVYLWLRPTPRWQLAVAAWLSAITVALPMVALPPSIGAAIATSGDLDTTLAVFYSMILAGLAYSALFLLVGLVIRRALIWGMVYLFIWEFFVARVGSGAANLSINTYPAAVLSNLADVNLPITNHTTQTGVIVPLVVSAIVLWLTAWRLKTTEVS